MKKLLALFGILLFISCPEVYAEKSRVSMEIWQTGNVDASTTVRRSPMRIPIDVYYDDELHLIEIFGDVDMSVQICLYDENGKTINDSPSINTMLKIPCDYSGLISIRIEGEDWNATGKIVI